MADTQMDVSRRATNGRGRPGPRPDDAIHVVLEFPVFAVTPPVDGPVQMWNEGVAASDLPDVSPAIDLASGESLAIPLDRIILEFSPLELGVWDAAEMSGESRSYLWGIFLQREDPKLITWAIYQEVPCGSMSIVGPLEFAVDHTSNRLVGPALPIARKGLMAALTVLRELSSQPLLCPFPMLIAGEHHVLRVQGGSTLLRVALPQGGHTHVVRDPSNDPFDASRPAMGVAVFDSDSPWASAEPAVVNAALQRR